MRGRYRGWSGAIAVTVITAALVVLDLSDGSVRRYWYEHSFSSSVLSGLLVLLLTALVVDRVTRMRHFRDQSRAIAAQAAVIVVQAKRAVDAVTKSSPSAEDQDAASDELRTYTQMLMTSAPVLIDANRSRVFLESGQRLAGQLFRALRDDGKESPEHRKARLDREVDELRANAAPLLAPLTSAQREAVSPGDDGANEAGASR